MVLPAWPPLAVPASWALVFRPELLHASPARMRAATAVEILNIETNMGHVYWVGWGMLLSLPVVQQVQIGIVQFWEQ